MVFSYFFQVGAGVALGFAAVGYPVLLLWRKQTGSGPARVERIRRRGSN